MFREKLREEIRGHTGTVYKGGYHRVFRMVPEQSYQHTPPCKLARFLLRQGGFVVWDTETTGLEYDSKIVSIGIVDEDGDTLVDTLINPQVPIPRDATWIHGVMDEMVKDAPTFEDVYPQIREALRGKVWIIYNASYDTARLEYECNRYYLPQIGPYSYFYPEAPLSSSRYCYSIERPAIHCAMEMYAEYHGALHDYYGTYTWQKLSTAASRLRIQTGKAHNALADAITTYQVIKQLALREDRKNEME